VLDGDVVRDVVEQQADAASRQLLAGDREPDVATEVVVDGVAADGVGRAGHVRGREVRQELAGLIGPHLACPMGGVGTALPHPHQPHGIGRRRQDRVPHRGRDVGEGDAAGEAPAELVEPHPGVDLQDGRVGRPGPRAQLTSRW
jgi:hypothetical protein